MATQVVSAPEDVQLYDGTVVELKSLPIAHMRRFMKEWNVWMDYAKAQEAIEDDKDKDSDAIIQDKQYDAYIAMAAVALEGQLKGTSTAKEYKEKLESILDEPTIFRILDKCGGIKLGETNLQEAISQMEMETE